MKKIAFSILIAVFILASSGCQPKCMTNPQDDGKLPYIALSVFYRNSEGTEVSEEYNTDMPEPEALTGFDITIPENEGYSLLISGTDGGGILSMQIHNIWFDMTPRNNIVKEYGLLVEKDYSSCASEKVFYTIKFPAHAGIAKHYMINYTDFQGHGNGIGILIVPIE